MARLNEPPAAPVPAAETVEVVKRRYLRQNRELAKTNSLQSIRIRNLETEGSRLLAENLSLREQLLQLQNATNARSNRPSFEDINTVKSRLEAKLLEFGGLVAELGQLQKPEKVAKRKSQPTATRPEERQWRSGLGLQAVEDAMMPTIAEDKYYPRRTMGADELRNILEETDSQSPDLGPPPVSQFANEEPIAFDPNPTQEENAEEPMEDVNPALSMNLETRKKRRESGPKDMRRVSMKFEPLADEPEAEPRRRKSVQFEAPVEEVEAAPQPKKSVRTGAKRKFSVQEDEDRSERPELQSEPFSFTRKNTAGGAEDAPSNNEVGGLLSSRPVLGSKPVNTDPVVSPKKQRSSVSSKPDKKAPEKRATSTRTVRGRLTITRTAAPEQPPIQLPAPPTVDEVKLDPLPPKTPAAETIVSPPSTEPSTTRPTGRDTPPPSGITSTNSTSLGTRPSRRAASQAMLCLKEPKLGTKMRRPGEKTDAVSSSYSRRPSVEPTSTVKKDSDEPKSTWKSLPSASADETHETEAGSPLREKLGRNLGEPLQEPPKLNSSAASTAISALISATGPKRRTSHSATSGSTSTNVDSEKADPSTKVHPSKDQEKDNIAIFDFEDTPPNELSSSRPRVDLAKLTAKSSRRHSALPASSSSEERKCSKADGNITSLLARPRTDGGVKSSDRSATTSKASVREKKSSASALPSSGADADLKEGAPEERSSTAGLRAERAASRRKSMMI